MKIINKDNFLHGNLKNRVGESFISKDGYKFKIILYTNSKNCTIEFEDGFQKNKIEYFDILNNNVSKKHVSFLNKQFNTYQGYIITIIIYKNCYDCTVQFNDLQKTIRKKVCLSNIKTGKVSNPNHKTVYNIGYVSVGKYSPKYHVREYDIWSKMIGRCYSEILRHKFPTYKDVTVCEEWHNFQNFAEWYINNYNLKIMQKWHLDKDILVKRNKIYSPETCVFIPSEINLILTNCRNKNNLYPTGVRKNKYNKFTANIYINKKTKRLGTFNTPEEAFQAYKVAKEQYIKEVADKWKDKIEEKVYNALYDYQVEITD